VGYVNKVDIENKTERTKVAAIASFKDGKLAEIKYEETLVGAQFFPHAVVLVENARTPNAAGYVPGEDEGKAWVYSETGLRAEGLALPDVPAFSFSGAFQMKDDKIIPLNGLPILKRPYSPELLRVRESYLPGIF
jgi:hypothetical protein